MCKYAYEFALAKSPVGLGSPSYPPQVDTFQAYKCSRFKPLQPTRTQDQGVGFPVRPEAESTPFTPYQPPELPPVSVPTPPDTPTMNSPSHGASAAAGAAGGAAAAGTGG